MHASIKFDRPKIPENNEYNVRLMVNLESETAPGRVNKPLNLALVLDRSGSMSGQKLRYVKDATKMLIQNLDKDDFFSLTMFDSQVTPLILPVKAGQAHGVEQTIDSIHSGDTTHLSGGYQQGCAFIKEEKTNKNISRVMLLTDGLANRGITDPGQLAELAAGMQVKGISTTTIGVGEDYNEFLLGKMAENGGGGTYFIENPDDALGVFEEELGYLKSLAATECTLKVVMQDKSICFDQLNNYKVSKDNAFLLGDIYQGQAKNLVLELELPEMEIGSGLKIGHIEVSYRDASKQGNHLKHIEIPILIDVVSQEEFANIKPDKDVVTAAAFLTLARGKREAIELSDQRKYKKAARLLEEYADAIDELIFKSKLDHSRLMTEVKELRKRARNLKDRGDAFYNRTQRKRMYYESEFSLKSNLSRYDSMMARRRPEGFSRNHMSTFPCYLVNGHLWAEMGNDRVLIDSGAQMSLGHKPSFTLGPERFTLNRDFMGFDVDDFSRLLGMRFTVMLGADILNKFDYIIDMVKEELVFSSNLINIQGDELHPEYFQGIPIISAETGLRNVRLFFSTGTKLSFIKSSLVNGYPSVGQDTDFYPGFGEFQVDTYKIPLSIARHRMEQHMGTLPQMLEAPLTLAGVDGILGTSILDSFKVCFSAKRKQIILQTK